MVPFPARRADDLEPLQPDAPSRSRIQPQIDKLASQLEAQGIQSTDLVLDLVLHDLADEAREAVGATGAAVALERDGELVCRAAAGQTAPDLGVRINAESGLSGLCVKQGKMQICSDTESDDRIDAEACRRLAVRSIVVIPLFAAERIIGIFEVFSERPNAYSTEDVKTLESLAATAAQTVQAAARQKVAASAESKTRVNGGTGSEPASALSVESIMEKVSPMDPAVRVLRWLVIGLAIPLVILIGFDWGWHRARSPIRALSAPRPDQGTVSELQTETVPANSSVPSTTSAGSPKSVAPKRKVPHVATRGGLVIYQNGKVIYQEAPTAAGSQKSSPRRAVSNTGTATDTPPVQKQNAASADASAVSRPPGVTGGRLLLSVRPQYPAEAILDKREGAVVLHGTVGHDGVIHDLKVVSGDPILSPAALEAVQHWQYEPYRRDGKPVDMPLDITIDFNLPK